MKSLLQFFLTNFVFSFCMHVYKPIGSLWLPSPSPLIAPLQTSSYFSLTTFPSSLSKPLFHPIPSSNFPLPSTLLDQITASRVPLPPCHQSLFRHQIVIFSSTPSRSLTKLFAHNLEIWKESSHQRFSIANFAQKKIEEQITITSWIQNKLPLSLESNISLFP